MADFDTIDELLAYELSSHPELSGDDTEYVSSVVDLKQLKKYAQELRAEIIKNLNMYYNSYEPIDYIRTRNLLDALDRVKIDQTHNMLTIDFNDNAWHKSMSAKNFHYSFVPTLVNYGWDVGPRPRNLERSYNYYAGSGYLTKAIADFNKKYKRKGIFAQLIINGLPVESYGNDVPYEF